ncbi:MAG: MBOAT family protein [Clostridiales bacterium]|nr:MBOAT family protein [Clostridiales bacterium]
MITVVLGRAIDSISNKILRKLLFVLGTVINISILGYYKFLNPFCSLRYFALFIFTITATVVLVREINSISNKALRKLLLVGCIAADIIIWRRYEYINFVISTLNRILDSSMEIRKQLLPLGISFFTFKAVSYLVDVYKGKIELHKYSPMHDALYLSFFAQVQSGPITRYGDSFQASKIERNNLFSDGVWRFLIGFNKKILLANVLSKITSEIFSTGFENFSTAYAWLGAICYSLQLFYDFAGYSDMAIGISEMFGYKCIENFDYPYMTESVTKFWRRWHISLSQWFRDYIYIQMGGSRTKHKYQVYINLFVVWILTGLWHGTSWNFVAWGLGYFVLIAFERITGLPDKFKSKFLKGVYRVFSLIFISCQWVLFKSDGIVSGLRFIKRMFIPTFNYVANRRALFLIKDYFIFILFAVALCFPVIPWIRAKMKTEHGQILYDTLVGIVIVFLFVWSLSYVVAGQNNPFAYANF